MLAKDLKNIPLFKHFPKAALKSLSQMIEVKEYDDNRLIFKQGKTRDRLYIILSGRVLIEKDVLGSQEPLAVFKPYDVLGETIMYSPGGLHNHTGKSYSPQTKVAELSVYNLLKLFRQHSNTSYLAHQYFIKNLSQRLSRTNDKLLTLFATSKLAVNFKTKSHLVESLLKTLLELFAVKKAFLATFDSAGQRIIIEQTAGYGRQTVPKVINMEADTLISRLLNQKKPLIISPQNWEKQYQSMPYAGKHMLLVPIATKKSIIGCLALIEKNSGRAFSLNNQILLSAIAEQVSPGLEALEDEQTERNTKALGNVYIDPFYT